MEARAAFAQAQRRGRLTRGAYARSVELLDGITAEVAIVEVAEALVRTACQLAEDQGLRGYDAVHLAAALAVADADTVFLSGDWGLLAAAVRVGLAVAPTA